jgi:hypothetical protein
MRWLLSRTATPMYRRAARMSQIGELLSQYCRGDQCDGAVALRLIRNAVDEPCNAGGDLNLLPDEAMRRTADTRANAR